MVLLLNEAKDFCQKILLKLGKARNFSDFVAAKENQKFITKGDLLSENFSLWFKSPNKGAKSQT